MVAKTKDVKPAAPAKAEHHSKDHAKADHSKAENSKDHSKSEHSKGNHSKAEHVKAESPKSEAAAPTGTKKATAQKQPKAAATAAAPIALEQAKLTRLALIKARHEAMKREIDQIREDLESEEEE